MWKSVLGIATILISVSGVSAQEEGGGFELGLWQTDGTDAFVSTFINDAENRFVVGCYTNPTGLDVYYTLHASADDYGTAPDMGWEPSHGQISTRVNGSIISTPIVVSEVSEGSYGLEISFHPTEGQAHGSSYREEDSHFISSLMAADIIEVRLESRRNIMDMTFSAKGSASAIRQTDWCNPEQKSWGRG